VDLEALISQAFIPLLVGGGGVAVINALFGRRKTIAEAESIETETATKLLRGVTEEIGRLQERIRQLEERVEKAESRADQARKREEGLTGRFVTLRNAYRTTLCRVEYLTEIVSSAGLDVTAWTPPKGLELEGR
jgi:TolA-binding protein